MDRTRRGEPLALPEWEDWASLFHNGVAAFVLFLVYAVAPLAVAWVIPRGLHWAAAGSISYLPMMPVWVLCVPLTAAGSICTRNGPITATPSARWCRRWRWWGCSSCACRCCRFFGFAGFAVPGTT
jgi:hypothetical protein